MFDIAWSEFLIVAVVALVVVGPRDLPGLLRQVGRLIGTVRRMAGDFQTQFNDALREAELDELRREVSGLKDVGKKALGGNPFSIARDELTKAIDPKPAATPSALAGETPPATAAPAEAEAIPSAFAPTSSEEAKSEPPAVPHPDPTPAASAAAPPPADTEAAPATPSHPSSPAS